LFPVNDGQFFENDFTPLCEGKTYLAAILLTRDTLHIIFYDKPVGQPDGAVMQNLQPLGQFANSDVIAAKKTLDCQHGLMLLRRDSGRVSCLFTKTEESSQTITELGEHFIVLFGDVIFSSWHEFQTAGGA